MRELDHAHTGDTWLLHNLITKGLHARPMDFRAEMMFGMVAIVKPGPVVKLVVAAYAPGQRLVRIAAIMPVETVQVRKAVTEVVKRKKESNVTPVEDTKNDEGWRQRA